MCDADLVPLLQWLDWYIPEGEPISGLPISDVPRSGKFLSALTRLLNPVFLPQIESQPLEYICIAVLSTIKLLHYGRDSIALEPTSGLPAFVLTNLFYLSKIRAEEDTEIRLLDGAQPDWLPILSRRFAEWSETTSDSALLPFLDALEAQCTAETLAAQKEITSNHAHLRDLDRRLNVRLATISATVADQEDQISELRREAEDLVAQRSLTEVALAIQASISELKSRISELDTEEKEIRVSEKEKVELRIQLTKMNDVGVKDLQKDEEAKESELRKQLEEMELEIAQLEKEENDLVLEISVAEDRMEATDVEKVVERWNEGLDAEIARIENQVAKLKVVINLETGLEADFGWSLR
jgi:hypothetical protein